MEVERILAGSSDGFVAFDRDFRYTYVNDAAARMSGKGAQEMLGQNVWQLFPDAAGGHLQREFERAMRDDVRVELEYFDAGRKRWYENRIYPAGDGICVHFVDITVRKAAEEALRESDRHKDEFLAILAHELRNPLAPLRLATEILRRATDAEQVSAAHDAINRQVDAMARLIDDLVGVSQISGGRYRPADGAELVARLPASEDASSSSVEPLGGTARARVLIADDNADAARSLATYLELVGCDVQTAGDGSTALSAAARFRPHVALLDLSMPALNGFELARLIRQAAWGSRMTLVAVTGWGQEHVRQRSRDAGFDHHLVKPVSPETIHGLLRELRAPLT